MLAAPDLHAAVVSVLETFWAEQDPKPADIKRIAQKCREAWLKAEGR
jgi:hypothetical protein